MTTPMTVYARVAGRYAIDASDDADIDEFFLKIVPTLPQSEREQIFKELLAASGLPGGGEIESSEPPTTIPLIPLSRSIDAPAPPLQHHDIEYGDRARGERDERLQVEYRTYYPRVARFFEQSFEVSPETAQELAQDVFVRFYTAMDENRGEAEWAFLETIARSVAFNYIRAARTAKRPMDDPALRRPLPLHSPDPGVAIDAARRRTRLFSAIAELPESQRLCLQLWLEGFTYVQIAEAMVLTAASVKSLLHEAKRALLDRLGEEAESVLAGREASAS